jgi:tetratricopeptide (TPR) repeat protein
MVAAPTVYTVLLALSLLGDIVVLKNGNEIQGEILREDGNRIVIEFPGGTLELQKRNVSAVKRQSRLDYLTDEAEKFRRRGDSEEAIELYREALAEGPRSTRAQTGLRIAREQHATELEDLGRYGEAKEAFATLLESDPSSSKARGEIRVIDEILKAARKEEERGRREVEEGELEKGIWRLQRIYEQFPERRKAVGAFLGQAIIREGHQELARSDWRRAESLYLQALSIDPELLPHLQSQYVVAKVSQIKPLLQTGDFVTIGKAADAGLEVDPANKLLRYYRGLALEGSGEMREAAEEYLSITGGRRPVHLEEAVSELRQKAQEKLIGEGKGLPTTSADTREVLAGNYRELRTRRFKISHKNSEVARNVALVAERTYAELFKRLGCSTHLRQPIGIAIFTTREEYVSHSGMQSWSSGAHQIARKLGSLSEHRIYSFQNQPRLTTGVLPHEISHALFTHRMNYPDRIPLWASEGFAVSIEPNYAHRFYNNVLHRAVTKKTFVPVKELVQQTSYPEEDVDLFYGQAYSLTEFLIQLEGTRKFVDFVKTLTHSRANLQSSLHRFYSITNVQALENRWLGWFEHRMR